MTIAEILPHVLFGIGTSLSLIVAIGAQNAYVLKQGIIGKFIWPIAYSSAWEYWGLDPWWTQQPGY